jgi:flagellar motor switch protein FliN/FliY
MVNQATALLIETGKARGWHTLKGRGELHGPTAPFQDVFSNTEAESDSEAEQLELRIELGRTHLTLDEVQTLRKGAVLLLDGPIDEPVFLYAGERLIGRGEIVVVDGKIGVRVLEIEE